MNFPADQKVRDARQTYYLKNGIPPDGGASNRFGRADFGPITIYVPNFSARVAALQRHDLHHIILDADTSMRGEAVVGGFETGSGCGRFWVAWLLEPQTIAYGLVLNPRGTFQSFLLGRRSSGLYHGPFREEWLDMTVGQLRKHSLKAGEFKANGVDYILFLWWSLIGITGLVSSLALLLLPFIGIFFFIKALIR